MQTLLTHCSVVDVASGAVTARSAEPKRVLHAAREEGHDDRGHDPHGDAPGVGPTGAAGPLSEHEHHLALYGCARARQSPSRAFLYLDAV